MNGKERKKIMLESSDFVLLSSFSALLPTQRHNQNLLQCRSSSLSFIGLNSSEELQSRTPVSIVSEKGHVRYAAMPCVNMSHEFLSKRGIGIGIGIGVGVGGGSEGELSDEDDDLCPVECVREFKRDDEFIGIVEKAKESGALVVVDFYRTSCGSCKYIEQGFAKLCRGSGDQLAPVIFLKHNVVDEYDEQSEVAERLRIKTVPLFHFYKDGILLEAFPTRDKERILTAISKYSSTALQI